MSASLDPSLLRVPHALELKSIREDWGWLVPEVRRALYVSAFGDLLLEDDAGAITFLDVTAGEASTIAASCDELARRLADPLESERLFRVELVRELERSGLRPGTDECYAWMRPPVLGGEVRASNVEIADLAVTVSLWGQIHAQLRNFPAGTKISGVGIK